MPTIEQVQAGTRKGLQRLTDLHGMQGASDRCGLTEPMIRGMLNDENYQWPGVGAQERIATALGISLDALTSGDF